MVVKDCSMKLQYSLLYLKVLALVFVYKLNNGKTGNLTRCGYSLNVATQSGLCSMINAYIEYLVILMKISQETAFLFFKTIKE